MIHSHSLLQHEGYDELVKRLSLEGFRSIAFSFREVAEEEVQPLLNADRAEFLQNTAILGLVTFVNLIKPDARQTIETLRECNIGTKIITGDNIFLGIQTAFATGMIPDSARVVVLEGRHFDTESGMAEVVMFSKDGQGAFREERQRVEPFAFVEDSEIVYAVDNDFVKARDDFLHHKIFVFARISPENKALIIRKHKELYEMKQKGLSFWQRLTGECGLRVGMVGDGANDLIAIKEADVGIGIASSDAVYSAAFTISRLWQIDEIIR
jgi:cation-transporting P-type ATPase 13A2